MRHDLATSCIFVPPAKAADAAAPGTMRGITEGDLVIPTGTSESDLFGIDGQKVDRESIALVKIERRTSGVYYHVKTVGQGVEQGRLVNPLGNTFRAPLLGTKNPRTGTDRFLFREVKQAVAEQYLAFLRRRIPSLLHMAEREMRNGR